jgi:hypothetical protein
MPNNSSKQEQIALALHPAWRLLAVNSSLSIPAQVFTSLNLIL